MTASLNLKDLPLEVIRSCVVPCLQKEEQHRFLSLCKDNISLLKSCRYICLSNEDRARDYSVDKMNYRPHRPLWYWFRTCPEYRKKILNILGWNADNAIDQSIPLLAEMKHDSHKRIQLKYTTKSMYEDKEFLKEFAHLFCQIANESITNFIKPPDVLENPTAEKLELQFRWFQIPFGQGTLQGLCQSLQASLTGIDLGHDKTAKSCSSPTILLSSWRGIHAIYFSHPGRSFCFQLSQNAGKLMEVAICGDTRNIYDLTILDGIPVVAVFDCPIVNLAALSNAEQVQIVCCTNVVDVSMLANVQLVALKRMHIDDISMLGNVKKLVLHKCTCRKYPVPSSDHNQSWEFCELDIVCLTGYDSLHSFKLQKCHAVQNIQMLGKVKSLSVIDCKSIEKLPIPVGHLQEWQFERIELKYSETDQIQFQQMHQLEFTLMIFQCTIKVHNVEILLFRNCKFFSENDCVHISDVGSLTLKSIFKFNWNRLQNVSRISLNYCDIKQDEVKTLHPDCNLSHLKIRACNKINKLSFLTPVDFVSLKSLVISDCKYLENIDIWLEDLSLDAVFALKGKFLVSSVSTIVMNSIPRLEPSAQLKESLENFSIRSAVDLWCIDEQRALITYGDIAAWDVSEVTDMSHLFEAKSINQNINAWDVSNVTNMSFMFKRAQSFNQPLDQWNVSSVVKLCGMFSDALSFNQPLDSWNVSNSTTLSEMFHCASAFNQPVNSWNVSNVSNMSGMFDGATSFNQPLNSWNVNNVTDMSYMFYGAASFNQPVHSWNVEEVSDMSCMFKRAKQFNQSQDNWNVKQLAETYSMFSASGMSQLPCWIRLKPNYNISD